MRSFTGQNNIKLTKLASCAGCGAKVGAGVLAQLLEGLPVHRDERLIVGYDKSDDASVYQISDELALVQTVDFFPPIADDPYLFGQIAAANSLSDVYAMGGEPKLAMNVMCTSKELTREAVHEILRGGYEKVYEADAIITGGHTIEAPEPKYGLSVTGFVHPKRVLTNAGAREGDVLILTKPLGIGIITTAAKAELTDEVLMARIYRQMAALNRAARDAMVDFEVHGCTDVTGFGLLGHGVEMAQGSGVTLHIETEKVHYHREAYEFAEMGFIPAGAYRNRDFAQTHVRVQGEIPLAMQDILYDPQTSGGLMISVAEKDAQKLLARLNDTLPGVAQIGFVTKAEDAAVVLT
ncbi:MAG: selenide, water dikinase SelD [Lachnospiraceae bacterium]